ncbi:MAG: hypothetical protein ACPLTP_00835 [Thermotoga caldifontis]|uniref:hypothetical protein n=1 Tax=Thermotoga caldifontis TaxID=1508419 RepID=UPI003C7AE4A1
MDLTIKVPLKSFVKLFREMKVLEYKYFVKHSIQVKMNFWEFWSCSAGHTSNPITSGSNF